MVRKLRLPLVLLLGILVLVCLIPSCDRNGEKDQLRGRLEDSEAERVRTEAQRARIEAQLNAVERELEIERERATSTEEDFTVAAVTAFSCVLAVFVLLALLVRERRGKKALLKLLRALQVRWRDGQAR